ncbi:hypothetical protein CBA19CS11_06585 [Caballeronia novacaledonica]|nr:hypothetical protein CBA19CS11_06585 [Caballeronia novacaledonica]
MLTKSSTDAQARLFRKSRGTGAMLCYMGQVLTDNRHGLVVNAQVTQANGTAERDTAAQMLADAARVAGTSISVGADKNYDTSDGLATLSVSANANALSRCLVGARQSGGFGR